MARIHTFRTTHYDICSEKLKGVLGEKKILFLTDLHNNSYGKENEYLIKAIEEQNPDLIFVGGDMLIGQKDEPLDVAGNLLRKLVSVCPVYCANGNHEQRMKEFPHLYGDGYEKYHDDLQKNGVIFLENEHVDFMWDTVPVRVFGFEIPVRFYKRFKKHNLDENQMKELLGQPDDDMYNIILAHNPVFADTYLSWGADLVLSGHLHGGIVRLPKLGGVITPQFGLFPKYSGELTNVKVKSVVVSKGLGTHTIKFRLFNPPELIVLHLSGNQK